MIKSKDEQLDETIEDYAKYLSNLDNVPVERILEENKKYLIRLRAIRKRYERED